MHPKDRTTGRPTHPRRRQLRTLFFALLAASCGVLVRGDAVSAQAQLVIKVATTETSRSPLGRQLRTLASDIEQRTKHTAHVKVFADGVLGDEATLLSRTIDGSIQMYAGQLRTLVSVVPEVAVLSAPFIFRDDKQLHRALDRPVRNTLDEILRRRGLVFGGWSGTARRVFISHTPLAAAADFGGLALRTDRPHADIMMAALGARAAGLLPVAGTEVPAKTGAVLDATPLRAIAEQTSPLGKHVFNTGHSIELAVWVYSKRWFDGLPEDLQTELRRPTKQLTADARRHRRQQNRRILQAWSEAGVEVVEPTAEQRKSLFRSLRKVAAQIAQRAGLRSWALLRAARRG